MFAAVRIFLLRYVLLFSYGYALLVALMPAPLRWRRPLRMRFSHLYVAYSAIVHCLCLLATPRAMSYYLRGEGYMTGWLTIIWSYSVSVSTKTLALFTVYLLTWRRRRRLIAALRKYRLFLRRYRHQCWDDETLDQRTHLERLIIAKFIVGLVVMLLGLRFFFDMHRNYGNEFSVSFAAILFGNFFSSTFLLVVLHQFIYALCLLRLQFARVNAALHEWQQRLRRLLQQQLNMSHSMAHQTRQLNAFSRQLATISEMHFDCYRLTQCVLQLYELPFGAYMLRELAVMVNMLFHTVQFVTARIITDSAGNLNGSTMVMLFIADVVLAVGMVDGIMTTCNETGALLRNCNELLPMSVTEEVAGDWAEIARELELFANRLQCHRLCYKVCGLYEFNRATNLGLMLSALVHVTVLMQFDLKLKLDSEVTN